MTSREVRERGPKKSKRVRALQFRVPFSQTDDDREACETDDDDREACEGPKKKSKRALQFHVPLSQTDDDQVLTFEEWCRLNQFSEHTGRRIIHSPGGPEYVNLTARRYGVTRGANRKFQARRTRRNV